MLGHHVAKIKKDLDAHPLCVQTMSSAYTYYNHNKKDGVLTSRIQTDAAGRAPRIVVRGKLLALAKRTRMSVR